MKTDHDKEIQLELIQALRDSLRKDSYGKLFGPEEHAEPDGDEYEEHEEDEDEDEEDEDEDLKRLNACIGK